MVGSSEMNQRLVVSLSSQKFPGNGVFGNYGPLKPQLADNATSQEPSSCYSVEEGGEVILGIPREFFEEKRRHTSEPRRTFSEAEIRNIGKSYRAVRAAKSQ